MEQALQEMYELGVLHGKELERKEAELRKLKKEIEELENEQRK